MKRLILSTLCILSSAALCGAQDFVRDSLEIFKTALATPESQIQGRVAGVRVFSLDGMSGGAQGVYIRGLNTLRADSRPLWIVDGAIIDSPISSDEDAFWQYGEAGYISPLSRLCLSPFEIESIEVVKDLSAAALYGAQGANGVIIVRTKRPRNGEANVSWRSGFGVNAPSPGGSPWRTAFLHNHTLGVNGQVGGAGYKLSAYLREDGGVAPRTGDTTGGVSAGFYSKEGSRMQFGINVLMNYNKGSHASGTAMFGQPSLSILARSESLFPGDTVAGWKDGVDDDSEYVSSVTSAYLDYRILTSLHFKLNLGLNILNSKRFLWYGTETSFGAAENGVAGFLGATAVDSNVSAELDWNRYFNKDHHIAVRLGAEVLNDARKSDNLCGNDFMTASKRAYGLALMGSRAQTRKFMLDYHRKGVFLNVSYDYKGLAGVSAVCRGDITPKFDGSSVAVFPGADAWFDLGRLVKGDGRLLSSLRLKAGYGESGREYSMPYELTSYYFGGAVPYVPEAGSEFLHAGLERLRSREWHVGADFGFLSGKLELSAQWYDKSTDDEFSIYCFGKKGATLGLWYESGREKVRTHNGSLSNRGLELSLDARILERRNFSWRAWAVAAFNTNRVTGIGAGDERGRTIGNGHTVTGHMSGHPAGLLMCYDDLSGDRLIVGSSQPRQTGAVGSTLRFGRVQVELLADAALGFDIANMDRLLAEGFNLDTDGDAVYDAYELTASHVEQGDYLRLARAGLSYSVPMGRIRFLKDLTVTAGACNLFTLSAYSGWNPDVNSFGTGALYQGVDYGSYPSVRTLFLGVRATF